MQTLRNSDVCPGCGGVMDDFESFAVGGQIQLRCRDCGMQADAALHPHGHLVWDPATARLLEVV
ncbi:hypothetical protein [Nocardia sp. CA-120079]|uniref:hypothetical protein n=1 Tax=Nocardia sp. CA-120079 TaxID=3239974 RepID=UPI003D96AEEE